MKNLIFSISFILFQLINYSQALPKRNLPITDGTPIKLQNSIYTITPPSGYLYMPQYASFMNNEKETSITVTEHDSSSYYMMVTAILKSDFSKQKRFSSQKFIFQCKQAIFQIKKNIFQVKIC